MSPSAGPLPQADHKIAVDIGGTFTDGILHRADDGAIWLAKALTTPEDPGRGVTSVVESLLQQMRGTGFSPSVVQEVVHATTLVTNAVIERKGGKTALVVTKGTADLMEIRREDRYDLYDLDITFPEPLVPRARRVEVAERLTHDGRVHQALTEAEIARVVARLKKMKVQAVAVCLLHAYVNDVHERVLKSAIQAALPDLRISLASETAREIREFERMSTTAANAYVQPVAAAYLQNLQDRLHRQDLSGPLRIMVSSGGFTSSDFAAEMPIGLLESGPAAGVLSAVNTGSNAGIGSILTFDMGGTTAKACVAVDGKPQITNRFEAGRVSRFKKGSGLPIMVPSIDLIEIGAGGGSIAQVSDLGLLKVGPQSAGSQPGPACYDNGGMAPTVTDADLLLGYLSPKYFLGGRMTLSEQAARDTVAGLADQLGMDPLAVAFGIFDLVNENMAGAARVHIAEKGLDPRNFTMVATGGAGPVHAVEVAAKLGIARVICSLAAGNGSCLGLLVAPTRADRSWSQVCILDRIDWPAAQAVLDGLMDDAKAELEAAGSGLRDIQWSLTLEMRYAGQGDTIPVEFSCGPLEVAVKPKAAEAFQESYRRLYSRSLPLSAVEVVTWRLIGRSPSTRRQFKNAAGGEALRRPEPIEVRRVFLPQRRDFAEVPVYDRYGLPPGAGIQAPAILQEPESTIVVARDAAVRVLPDYSVSVELG